MVKNPHADDLDDAVVAAFWRARQEAESWSRVYEMVRRTACVEAKMEGLSYAQIADRLELSKPMVTRILAGERFGVNRSPMTMSPDWGEADQARFDDMWIEAGAPKVASPDGQYRHGIIDDAQRDELARRLDLAAKPIPEQLHDAVVEHPGLTARELLPYMCVAVTDARTVSFAHHAHAAWCAVDGAGRYWPAIPAIELRTGDRVPRHQNGFSHSSGGEWVTIIDVSVGGEGQILEISFTLDDGLVSAWHGIDADERHPVDRRNHQR
ncbi:hypothetical protein [Gordonia aquimaris]|uniref:Uncharacterized protein n=1 Tax=Gordonia aquimaris TaxID=2984863 RepID=A0A9X3D7B7_9ACTN|nr:hypothetical protein [Gordonia aquimaris]MCX2966218.1 hypothetical protein [Gordonia aquimaris]